MSIKARLILSISILIGCTFLLIGVVTVQATQRRMIARVDAALRAAPFFEQFAPHRQEDGARRATAILIIGQDNVVRGQPSGYPNDPDPLPEISFATASQRQGRIFTVGAIDDADFHYRVMVRRFQGGFLVQAMPLADVEATVHNLIRVITLTALLVLAFVVVAVWLTVERGLRPIDDMIATAGLIAEGDLSHRVEHDDSTSEVGRLGHALNSMLGRIESSFAAKEASEQRLRQFVADASHELRTPLTSIRGYAELFRSGAASDPATLERVMLRIESEGMRMGKLIDDMLLLARLDQGRPLQQEPVDLVVVVEDAVMDARAVDPQRPLQWDHPEMALVRGDVDRLRQIVGNVLTNARVHTSPETPIHITLTRTPNLITLRIADEGPGIAPEDAAHVFDRFYRVDAARARDSDSGTGLGLSIVSSLVRAHGGDVTLESEVGRGTTVTITLPPLERSEH